MKWYNTKGEESDVVISTRIRLSRNLKNYPFPCRLNAQAKKEVSEKIRAALSDGKNGDFGFIDMSMLTKPQAISLAERHLISPEFTACAEGSALMITKDESVSLMLCEEDHIRLQVIKPGLALEDAYNEASKIDTALDGRLHFAFDDKLGYLTQHPTNLGTAMKASIMMHLPALTRSGKISRIASTVSKLGLVLRGTYGEGSKPLGDIYLLSNQITLGISEEAAITNLKSIASHIIEQERTSAKELAGTIGEQDRIFRALGLLKYARLLTSRNFMELISLVRMGAATGVLDIPTEKIDDLIINMQPATISAANADAEDVAKRDKIRAQAVREAFEDVR
ncbi:MAG: protein arginine kinase [Clostridia bacterium]|nr:protein arginine kinase [Clostridia bacterium]